MATVRMRYIPAARWSAVAEYMAAQAQRALRCEGALERRCAEARKALEALAGACERLGAERAWERRLEAVQALQVALESTKEIVHHLDQVAHGIEEQLDLLLAMRRPDQQVVPVERGEVLRLMAQK